MPQHLRIEVDDDFIGRISTDNKPEGDTFYDITFCSLEPETNHFLRNVNTEVRKNRNYDIDAFNLDMDNEVINARRCIAAAVHSANEFLIHLRDCKPTRLADKKPITMKIMTNNYERGFIHAEPTNGQFDVTATIPRIGWKWPHRGGPAAVSCNESSHIGRALAIIQSIGPELLNELENEANNECV